MPRQRESMKPWKDLDKISIDHFRQNRPSYVVEDILHYFSERFGGEAKDREAYDAVWSILLARGVLKWMSSRRAFLTLKMLLRARIRSLQLEIQQKKKDLNGGTTHLMRKYGKVSAYHLGRLRGSLESTELIYKNIRKICHSIRWQVPDNDVRHTPHWIAGRAPNGKELLMGTKSESKEPEKLSFPDWLQMKVGDIANFSCSVCQKIGDHTFAGVTRSHGPAMTYQRPIWICPKDIKEVELACFKCGSVEKYGPCDERLCRCGAIPYAWSVAFSPSMADTSNHFTVQACNRCEKHRNVVSFNIPPGTIINVKILADEITNMENVCAECSYRDPGGSWFGVWIKIFNRGDE